MIMTMTDVTNISLFSYVHIRKQRKLNKEKGKKNKRKNIK